MSLVFLHPFCNTAADCVSNPAFAHFRRCGLRVVLPTAARRPISAHGGTLQHSWYDYLTDNDGLAEDDIDRASLAATRQGIIALIDAEAALLASHKRVLVGGISQGCCVAFDAFAQHGEQLGGFIGMVGHPLKVTPSIGSQSRNSHCCLFNGSRDEIMRSQWVRPKLDALTFAGWSRVEAVEVRGVGHHPSLKLQGEWMYRFFDSRFREVFQQCAPAGLVEEATGVETESEEDWSE